MKVVVTGGLGFIGSHTVVELQQQGFEVVIIDNLSNSSTEVINGIVAITGITPQFEELDLRHKASVEAFFAKHSDVAGLIHFAASKAVGESVENPLLYYENNINALVYVLQALQQKLEAHFIFSSSCTVYGQAEHMPITENASIQVAMSPYGNTKDTRWSSSIIYPIPRPRSSTELLPLPASRPSLKNSICVTKRLLKLFLPNIPMCLV